MLGVVAYGLREIVLALALFFDRGFGLGFLLFFVCGQKSLIQLVVLQGGSDDIRAQALALLSGIFVSQGSRQGQLVFLPA